MISSINIPLISEEYPNSWHSKQSRTPLWCLLLLFLFVVFLLFVYAGILVENMYIRLSLFYPVVRRRIFFCNRESLNCTFWDFLPTVDPCSWKDERLRYRCQTPHKVTCQNFRDPALCYRTILLHTNQKMYYYSLYMGRIKKTQMIFFKMALFLLFQSM